jgi:hypothetical protein
VMVIFVRVRQATHPPFTHERRMHLTRTFE